MPASNVTESLHLLEQELKKLEPAIKHVEMAVKLTQILNGLPDMFNAFLGALQKENKEHVDNIRLEIEKLIIEAKKLFEEIQLGFKALNDEYAHLNSAFKKQLKQLEEFIAQLFSVDFKGEFEQIKKMILKLEFQIDSLKELLIQIKSELMSRLNEIDNSIIVLSKVIDNLGIKIDFGFKSATDLANNHHLILFKKSKQIITVVSSGLLIIGFLLMMILLRIY